MLQRAKRKQIENVVDVSIAMNRKNTNERHLIMSNAHVYDK